MTVTVNGVTSSPVAMQFVPGTTYQYTGIPTINTTGYSYVVTATAYMNGEVVATTTWQGV